MVTLPPRLLSASQEKSPLLVIMGCYVWLSVGSVTMEDILTVLPFGATVDLVLIKGSTVKKAFEHAVRRYGSMSGEFLQVSGLFSSDLVQVADWAQCHVSIILSFFISITFATSFLVV